MVDSTRALLVWEPKRVVPTYAVPADDVDGELLAATAGGSADARPPGIPAVDGRSSTAARSTTQRPVLRPHHGGEPVTVDARSGQAAAAPPSPAFSISASRTARAALAAGRLARRRPG